MLKYCLMHSAPTLMTLVAVLRLGLGFGLGGSALGSATGTGLGAGLGAANQKQYYIKIMLKYCVMHSAPTLMTLVAVF